MTRNARQVDPGQPPNAAPATSNVNWWPYPSYSQWGQNPATLVTSQAVPTNSVPLTSLNAAVSLTSNLDTSSAPASVDPGSSALITPTPPPTLPAASTNSTLTTITALPPAKTASRHYKRPGSGSFNVLYLAPLFAFLGVVFGSLCAWLAFHLLDRRKARGSMFKSGPQYISPDTEGSIPPRTSEANSDAPFLGERRPSSRFAAHSSQRDNGSLDSNWLVRAFSSNKREPSIVGTRTSDVTDDSIVHGEDDPFLAPPPTHLFDRASSNPRLRPPTPIDRMRSPDALSENEELDNAPWDTLRHKSIRRGILDRVQYGSRYRKTHERTGSDLTVEEARRAVGQSKYLSVPEFEDSPSRGRSSTRGHSSPLVTPSNSSGPGFRIVQEDPDSGPQTGLLGWSMGLPWSKSTDAVEDKFTSLPPRRSPADRRRSPSPAVKAAGNPVTPTRAARPPVTRVDSSVLPSSPPQLMSPPLEAELFFGGRPPMLDTSLHALPREHGSSQPPSAKKARNKLHSQHALPLPFPSSGQYQRRLTKTPPRPVVRAESSTSTYSGAERARSPAERHARRHGALTKVEQILAESWSTRELRGEEVRSPTMFGAVVHQ